MRIWISALALLLWTWYLYNAFPSSSSETHRLNFVPGKDVLRATQDVVLPPFRQYDVMFVLEAPTSHHNHECGITHVALKFFQSNELFFEGQHTFLLADRGVWRPWGTDETVQAQLGTVETLTPLDLRVHANLTSVRPTVRFRSASLVLSQVPKSPSEVLMYFGLLIGFALLGLSMMAGNIMSLFKGRPRDTSWDEPVYESGSESESGPESDSD